MVYKLLFLSLALTIHLSASQILTVSPTCIQDGDLVKLRCQTTDFVSAISFLLSGTNKGGCTANSGSCGTGITGYVGPSQSGLFTELTISAYDHSRDGGSWTCEYGGTPSSIYAVKIGNCIILCIGVIRGYTMLITCNAGPQLVEILVLVLICCRCLCTQKAKINVQTPKRLTKAEYVNKDNRMRHMQPKKEQKEGKERYNYSCIAYGEQLLTCTFKDELSKLSFSFMISDDLLWANLGQTIILPTTWLVNADQLQLEGSRWYLNDSPLDIATNSDYEKGDVLSLKFKVNQSTIGTYKCEMTVNELEGWLISVSNMRVSGFSLCKPIILRNIVLVICTAINLGFCVFSMTYVYRNSSTNGYCVEVYTIFLTALIPQISLDLVILFLLYKLITEKKGKEQSSRCIIICICGCSVTPSNHGDGNQSKTNDGNGQQTAAFIPLKTCNKGELNDVIGKKKQLEPMA